MLAYYCLYTVALYNVLFQCVFSSSIFVSKEIFLKEFTRLPSGRFDIPSDMIILRPFYKVLTTLSEFRQELMLLNAIKCKLS